MTENRKKLPTSIKPLGRFIVVAGLLLVMFQNCSDVQLSKMEAETTILSSHLKSNVCTETEPRSIAKYKFVFVVDMSGSNLGSWVKRGNLYYWDPAAATDVDGQRFKAMKAFVNNISEESVEYLILGFTSTVGKVSKRGNSYLLECNGGFVNKSDALEEIDLLFEAQEETKRLLVPLESSGYNGEELLMTATGYTKSLACANSLLVDEFIKDTNSKNYEVFFLSDGAPKDVRGFGCEKELDFDTEEEAAEWRRECYLGDVEREARDIVQLSMIENKLLKINTIFYGSASPSEDDLEFVERMAQVGGSEEALSLVGFQSNQNLFNDIIQTSNMVEYEPELVFTANLTSINVAGQLMADSDMDGLSDEYEISISSDPQNPRSIQAGVLDSICNSLGGKEACLDALNSSAPLCDQIVDPISNAYHFLTECDMEILGLMNGGNSLIDYDADGIPNYIEVIKSLNPKNADTDKDPDSDGLTNLEELSSGTDPFHRSSVGDVAIVLGITQDPTVKACKQIDVKYKRYSATLEYNSSSLIELNHQKYEQVVYEGILKKSTNLKKKDTKYEYITQKVESKDSRHLEAAEEEGGEQ